MSVGRWLSVAVCWTDTSSWSWGCWSVTFLSASSWFSRWFSRRSDTTSSYIGHRHHSLTASRLW